MGRVTYGIFSETEYRRMIAAREHLSHEVFTPEVRSRLMLEAMRNHGMVEWLAQWERAHPWKAAAEGFTWAEYQRKRRARRKTGLP